VVDKLFQITFEPLAEMLEHRRSTREHDILRETVLIKGMGKEKQIGEQTLYKPRRTSMGEA
jgi:hypothetical protein